MATIWICLYWPFWFKFVQHLVYHGENIELNWFVCVEHVSNLKYHFDCRFVAATVLSINHVNSLKLESECAAPGEKPQFLGVREQRVTHILIFLTIGCSVFLTPLLSHIPMPVLFGVFLYMGAASLRGLQLFDRILIMFMPVKYQPDYMFLRQVIDYLSSGIEYQCQSVSKHNNFFPHRFHWNECISLQWFNSHVLWFCG